ncbi:hypothetical protein AB0F11_35070 [Streptomyces sp. NPDC032472]|uniref:hypothetical protein n=1 Tax=Streptomyces sp. NPDC032472 TaxID=3155018 RepID=UPI0033DC561A
MQVGFAAAALAAAAACLATRRGEPLGPLGPAGRAGRGAVTAGRARRVVVTVGLGVGLGVAAAGTLGLPAFAVSLLSLSAPDSATGLAHTLLSAAGTALLVPVLVAHRRRLRGACPRCGHRHGGRADGPLSRPAPSRAPRRTRIAAWLLLCGLLPWAAVKTVWTLGGDALGVTAEGWREANSGAPGAARALAEAGIDVTVLAAAVGVFLALGLLYRWGQVFPRWTLLLAGRRVPRLLPLLPAWACAAGLSLYGIGLLVYAPLSAMDVLPAVETAWPFTTRAGLTWMVGFGGSAFAGLGLALAVGACSYTRRTRPVCRAAAQDGGRTPARLPVSG